MSCRVRFAPSPTGYLHVGGARTALFNWLFARKTGGVFVLRIEDTDVARSSEEMTQGILDAMTWLGLGWDEGPFFQSQRLDRYREAADQLLASDHAYLCFCSPDLLEQKRRSASTDGGWQYDRACASIPKDEALRRRSNGEAAAVRFRVSQGAVQLDDLVFGKIVTEGQFIEDFVLLRSDGQPTYHLSVVVDDLAMDITHVIRGADHLSNTPKQILLYRAFGKPLPVFAHVPLILGPDKTRLSKRHGATSVLAYRDLGIVPEAFRNFLALLGWSPGNDQELFESDALIDAFALEGISKADAVFNQDKLNWFNAQYLSRMSSDRLIALLREPFANTGYWRESLVGEERAWLEHLLNVLRPRCKSIWDFVEQAEPYFVPDVRYDEAAVRRFFKEESLPRYLSELGDRLRTLEPFTMETTEAATRAFAADVHLKPGVIINAARVALTGRDTSPGIFDVMMLLGRARVDERMQRASKEIPARL